MLSALARALVSLIEHNRLPRSFHTAAISDTQHAAVPSGADVSAAVPRITRVSLRSAVEAQTAAMGLLRFNVPSQTLRVEDGTNTLALSAADLFW